MRIPRSILLSPEYGHVHKFWRCHNREFLLQDSKDKDLYLEQTKYALNHSAVKDQVFLHSFCIMDNHTHMNLNYEDDSQHLSNFMRIAHSRFGFAYNKTHNRSGKVANERPKTPLIENHEHNLRVQFYIEANPLRAKMMSLKQLKYYKYSSYGYYAYGIQTKWTSLLTEPDWYMELGDTARERQLAYRKLFLQYIKEESITVETKQFFENYIGGQIWKLRMHKASIQAIERVTSDQKEQNTS